MRKIGRVVREYLGVLIGVAVTAFGLTWFLIPGRIAAGGVSGLATVGYHLFDLPVGLTMLVLNIPLFAASITVLGAVYGAKTFIGTIVLSVLVDVFQRWAVPLTSDPLLTAVYGGVITGIGLGITFRSGGRPGHRHGGPTGGSFSAHHRGQGASVCRWFRHSDGGLRVWP